VTVPLKGDRVRLVPTKREDLPDLMRLWNDPRVMTLLGFPNGVGYTPETALQWFRDTAEANPNRHHYVARTDELRFCGEAHYTVDAEHRRAGLDIKFVPEAQGKGLAGEALAALIDHVFRTEPDAEEVWTAPAAANARAQKLYARCGLRPKGRPADMEPAESYWALERERWEGPSDDSD
jgi:RimJ/RimL family protein N-acetyltransferase